MKTRFGFGVTVLLSAAVGASAQAPATPEGTPGKALQVEIVETRTHAGALVETRSQLLRLHADTKEARLFVGDQARMTTDDRGLLTTAFKNVGLDAHVSASTLADGRYRVEATFERSWRLTPDDTGPNPTLRTIRAATRLTLGLGDSRPLASAVDPVTGDLLDLELRLAAAPVARPSATGDPGAPLRARLLVSRRRGEEVVARRPYAVTLPADEQQARVFSGSMLPVQVTIQDRPTIVLRDVGAGLQVVAHPLEAGRWRLDLSFSDGVVTSTAEAARVWSFETESQLALSEGETVVLGSAVDPESGETVQAQLTLERAKQR